MKKFSYLLATLCLAAIARAQDTCSTKGCAQVCIYDGVTASRCACTDCTTTLQSNGQCTSSGNSVEPLVLDSNNVNKRLSVKIPTCALMTMTCKDLKIQRYNDDICAISETVSDGLLVHIPPLTKNTLIEVQADKVKLSNSIVPGFADGKTYPSVEFAVETYFAVKKFEYSYTSSISRVDPDGEFFGTEIKFYTDDQLANEITDYKIKVASDLYLGIHSNSIPDGVITKIWSSTASEPGLEVKKITFQDGVQFWCQPICGLSAPNTKTILLKDQMFESGRTAFLEDSEKASIVYEVEFAQCVNTDAHAYCSASKRARKKRSLPDANTENRLQNYLDAEVRQTSSMSMKEQQPQSISMGANILFLIIFALAVNYLIPDKTERRS